MLTKHQVKRALFLNRAMTIIFGICTLFAFGFVHFTMKNFMGKVQPTILEREVPVEVVTERVEFRDRFIYMSGQFDHPDFGVPLRVPYVITSQMRERGEIVIGKTKSSELIHRGIDLSPVKKGGSNVYCVADGVVYSHWPACYGGHPTYGVSVIVKHDNGFYSSYSHLSTTYKNIKEGNRINKGDLIGVTGSTGFSTGEHLHFELVIDPAEYIDFGKGN